MELNFYIIKDVSELYVQIKVKKDEVITQTQSLISYDSLNLDYLEALRQLLLKVGGDLSIKDKTMERTLNFVVPIAVKKEPRADEMVRLSDI